MLGDTRSDLYSLGATLYHLITGETPTDAVTRVMELAEGNPDPLRPANEVNSQVTPTVAKVLMQALMPNRDRRFSSATAMRKALREAYASLKTFNGEAPTKLELHPEIQYFTETLDSGLKIELVKLPAGCFLMGSPDVEGRPDEHPQHEVRVASFYIGKYQVTQAQWRAVAFLPKLHIELNPDPSTFKGDNLPVEEVSWEEAIEFCNRLSHATGKKYRLPTEAEWEYACRAGTKGEYAGDLDSMGWYDRDSGGMTHPVGMKQANRFGLYDMHGNVWEWCMDRYAQDWYRKQYNSQSLIVDPVGPAVGEFRVERGGGWIGAAWYCRSACRGGDAPDLRFPFIGFRIVRTLN